MAFSYHLVVAHLLLPAVVLLLFKRLSPPNLLTAVACSVTCGWLAAYAVGVLQYAGVFSKPGMPLGDSYYQWSFFGGYGGALLGALFSMLLPRSPAGKGATR